MTSTIIIEDESGTSISNDADAEFADAVPTRGVRSAYLDRTLLADSERALTFVASTSGMLRSGRNRPWIVPS